MFQNDPYPSVFQKDPYPVFQNDPGPFGDSCRFLYQWYIIIPLYFSHLVSSYCSVQVAGRAFSRENQLGIQVLLGLLRLKRL